MSPLLHHRTQLNVGVQGVLTYIDIRVLVRLALGKTFGEKRLRTLLDGVEAVGLEDRGVGIPFGEAAFRSGVLFVCVRTYESASRGIRMMNLFHHLERMGNGDTWPGS